MKKFYLYILKCKDNSYYTGHTDNIEKRLCEHERGENKCYTQNRRPFKVVHVQDFSSRYYALVAERKLKKWSRAKKEAYINGDWNLVSKLARRKKNRS